MCTLSVAHGRSRRTELSTGRLHGEWRDVCMSSAVQQSGLPGGCHRVRARRPVRINRRTVGKILTRDDVQTKRPGLSPARSMRRSSSMKTDGHSHGVGEHLGVTARTVQLRLRERGVTMRDSHGRDR